MTNSHLPLIINLYYAVFGKKIFSEYDMGTGSLKILMYIIPIMVAYFVMRVMGYSG